VLETSDDLLQANMIIASQAAAGDTVVMIDISWPLPDNIEWQLPAAMLKLRDRGDVIHGKFEDPGVYNVTLKADLGQCHDEVTKSITIIDENFNPRGGRLGAEEFVKSFTLHPNPNTGSFAVEVEFIEQSPITVTIWNIVSGTLVEKTSDDGHDHYKKQFDLNPISSGTYILRLDYKEGYRTIRFLVH
jgi:hypothetical protein